MLKVLHMLKVTVNFECKTQYVKGMCSKLAFFSPPFSIVRKQITMKYFAYKEADKIGPSSREGLTG